MLEAFEYLKQRGMADCLQLVHFHLGSQITNIRNIKDALTEAARVYVELHRVGAGVKYLDVGGGLGIDYDGSQTDFESSVNYTLQEYANDVVFRIKSVCDEAGVPHPTIISESGRAVVAYHSVLVFDVLGVSNFDRYQVPPEMPADAPQPISDLFGIHRDLSKKNFLGELPRRRAGDGRGAEPVQPRPPDDRAARPGRAAVLGRVQQAPASIVRELDYVPEELQGLEAMLSDTYFCNFSVFQSMPDSWAIKQLFPIMPIHRLNEAPTRRGGPGRHHLRLGRQDRPVHRPARRAQHAASCTRSTASPTTSARSCSAPTRRSSATCTTCSATPTPSTSASTRTARSTSTRVIKGDTVREVLAYVQYSAEELTDRLRKDVERAVRQGKISLKESRQFLRFYESGLEGYTYLEEPSA